MAYSAEVVRKARLRLAQEKADRESEYQARLRTAYAQVPRLREIDKQMRRTMAKAAQSVFSQEGDVEAAMNQARQANQALQQERETLVAASFTPGFLNEAPVCEKCGGTGYVGSTMCQCLVELCRQEQRKELRFLGDESFDRFRLDYYPDRTDPKLGVNIRTVMEKTLRTCKRYAMTFSESAGNLLFSGNTGLGKTFLSACIARTVSDKGYQVAYESAVHLFSKLERAKFNGDEASRWEADQLLECDLLIMDDLGTELPSQFNTSALYTLINDRILARKPTIISTNLGTEDLEKRYSAQITSRLRGSFIRVAFVGEDIRVKKNWEL